MSLGSSERAVTPQQLEGLPHERVELLAQTGE
jgi:hypothetical protein